MTEHHSPSSPTGDSPDDRLGPLLDEFVERYRRGERPALTEYVERAPELEDEIRELFPALVAMEQAGPDDGNDAAPGLRSATAEIAPERLGEFRIVREIGRGGMGIVYEAVQESLDRTVALKVLPGLAPLAGEQRQRFQRESRTAAMLHHSNIVPVFGVGEHEGVLFYAMQFIEGRPLDDVLSELRRIRSASPIDGQPSKQTIDPVTHSVVVALSCAGQGSSSLTGSAPSAIHPRSGTVGREERATREGVTGGRHDSEPVQALPSRSSRPSPEEGEGYQDRPMGTGATEASDVSSLTDPTGQGGQFFRNVARIGQQAADALAYAHARDVLHRDIKPSNLLLDLRSTVWIADFGLARTSDDSLTQPGDLIGTLRYMAPERFRGDCSEQSDVYSLGLTLYELLTLQPAFDETDKPRLIRSVTHDLPAAPRSVDVRIPRDLETIVLKAIAREPVARYASAREMADDLQRFLAGRPIVARRTSVAERAILWARRNPLVAALLSVVAILIVLLAVGSTVAAFRLSQEKEQTLANLSRALDAEADARQSEHDALLQSYRSLVSRARALRNSRRIGRRSEGLEAVRQAAELLPQLQLGERDRFELRNEAIGCLSLVDLAPPREWIPDEPGPRYGHACWAVDASCERFAYDLASGEIAIHRFSDFAERQRLPGIAPFIHTLAWKRPMIGFSPDGQFLAAYGFVESPQHQNLFGFQLWDLTEQRLVMKLAEGGSLRGTSRGAFAFSPDSRTFYYVPHFGKTLRSLDLETGDERDVFDLPDGATFLAAHPDGQRIAVFATASAGSSRSPADVVCFDLTTGKPLTRFRHPYFLSFLGWTGDGRYLLTAAGWGDSYVWDHDNGDEPVITFRGHESTVTRIQDSDDGNLLITSSVDGTSRLWSVSGQELLRTGSGAVQLDMATRQLTSLQPGRNVAQQTLLGDSECRIIGHPTRTQIDRRIDSIAFSVDGQLLAATTGRSLCVWNRQTHRLLLKHEIIGSSGITFHPNGQLLIATSWNGVQLFDVDALRRGETVEGKSEVAFPEPDENLAVSDVSISDDGQTVAVVHRFSRVDILRAGSDVACRRVKAQNYVQNSAVSHDGRLVATSAPHNSLSHQQTAGVIVFAAESAEEIARLPVREGDVGRIRFNPDDSLLATVEQERVRLWNTQDWTVAGELRRDALGAGMVAFSPGGELIALADRDHVKLFDPDSLSEVARLSTPLDASIQSLVAVSSGNGLAFSPDGKTVAARSEDGSVLLWDLAAIRPQLAELGLDW